MKLSRHSQISLIAAAVSVAIMSATAYAQTPDPFAGTWKLDVAKSTYSPGPAPKSGSVTFSAAGEGVKVEVSGVAASGDKVAFSYTANHDGKEYPATGNPDADKVILKRLSGRSVEVSNKKAGKATLVNTRTVAADGKTMTVTTAGTNAKGEKVSNVQVYEKQ